MKTATFDILARGHENIQATHRTTFEVTKESTLTKRGDCIIGVEATNGAIDLPLDFKEAARRRGVQIIITIEAGELSETVRAWGSPRLLLSHRLDLVVRKSGYICSRTIAVGADKAACDLSRKLIEKIKDSNQEVRIGFAIEFRRPQPPAK